MSNRNTVLELMTTSHHCNHENEEAALTQMKELLSNSKPYSDSLYHSVPDAVRLALNVLPNLFLTASASYNNELLTEKGISLLNYCVRLPHWPLHSLLCVSDIVNTNQARPIKVMDGSGLLCMLMFIIILFVVEFH